MNKEVLPLIMASRWAILPEAFENMLEFVSNPELVSIAKTKKPEVTIQKNELKQEGTAIVPILGPIFGKENLLTLLFGGTSLSTFSRDFESAIQDGTVERVILFFDSPGGEVVGISEMAKRIYAARSQKQIISYVYGTAASAAYWLATAASKIIMADTAQVGSIGVIAGYTDTRKRDEVAGLSRIQVISSQTPRKNLDLATDAGKAELQRIVDQLAEIFINAVANYRDTTADNVKKNYGKGSILVGQSAVDIGMADEINTLEGILYGNLGTTASGTGPLAQQTPEEILGEKRVAEIRARYENAEPVHVPRVPSEEETFNAMVSGIAAFANEHTQKEEEEPLSDEERRIRYQKSLMQ